MLAPALRTSPMTRARVADIAAMAPGTNAGAAHVVFEFGKPDPTMTQKVENDAEAFLRSYVAKRNRNVDAALAAVQASHSYTAEEALDKHLIDLIASTVLYALALSLISFVVQIVTGRPVSWHKENLVVLIVYIAWQFLYFGFQWAADGSTAARW